MSNVMSAFSCSGVYIDIYFFKHPVWWQKQLGCTRSGSTAFSYRNCVITQVGSWWGQGIARAFTCCMMKKKKKIYIYLLFYSHIYIYIYIYTFKKTKNQSHSDYKFISILLWVLIWINNPPKLQDFFRSNG